MQVNWDNEAQTVIRLEVNPTWTIDDYLYGMQESNLLMDTVDYTVHVIADLRPSNNIPNGFLSAMRTQQSKIHPNTGVTVVVGAGTLITAAFSMINRVLYPKKDSPNYMTSTLEGARELLDEKMQTH